MARVILQADNLRKGVSGRTLLDDVSFQVEVGERVALVGPNGCGKSTLLRMIASEDRPEGGRVSLAPNAPLAYFRQHQDTPRGARVADVLRTGSPVPPELAAEAAALETRMADPALYESDEANAVLSRYGEVQREIAQARAQAAQDPTDSPLFAQLGFDEAALDRPMESLSGGERTRVHLLRALSAADPHGALVLDEPTNHLDVETIEWLEEWLPTHPGAVLLVAHDRAFLDNVATRILAFEGARLVSHPGNYSAYERLREEDQARLAALREREAKELERQKTVIEQFRHQKRFDGQMASRLTRLAKYRAALDRTPDPLVERLQAHVAFPETHKSSHDVLRVRGLGKRFGERLLFYDLDLDVQKGDRIGLVGANGAGKTTLLRILVGRERKDVGTLEAAPGVKGAYYAQGAESLDPQRTLKQEVLHVRPGTADEDVRALLGRFGFRHEHDADRKVGSLSGGERARLAILKTILTPSNLLVLDEPTNHLDLLTRKELVRALNAYKGSLVVVSHDRWFLDSVVNKVAVLARRQVKVFVGDLGDARTQSAMEAFSTEKPTPYVVKKAFKDYDANLKHTVGSVLRLTPADLEAKRLYRTALSLGWMAPE